MYIEKSPYLCGTKTEMMSKKKLGRPKGKDKPEGAEWLFHEWLTAEDKETLELFRLVCRVQNYNPLTHGKSPTALPKVTNRELLSRLVRTARHAYWETMYGGQLEALLYAKGCLNAAELLGLPEGPEQ